MKKDEFIRLMRELDASANARDAAMAEGFRDSKGKAPRKLQISNDTYSVVYDELSACGEIATNGPEHEERVELWLRMIRFWAWDMTFWQQLEGLAIQDRPGLRPAIAEAIARWRKEMKI
jgi:hypothetical protein